MRDVYSEITSRIIAALEAGTVPWHRPWATAGGLPMNLTTRKTYRGVNLLLLALMPFESPFWCTYKQAQLWGGHVRKGEKGAPIIFWGAREQEDEATGETERIPFLKSYVVFNAEQLELPVDVLPILTRLDAKPFTPIAECERVVAQMPQAPAIGTHAGGALYRPSTDQVLMPARERFDSPAEFYSVLFHELTHSTGHASRLNREGIIDLQPFGSPTYSREELVAEMGAAFLCGHAGILPATIENSTAYLAGWLAKIRGDSRLVIQAAAAAQKSADFILGTKFEPAAVE